MGSARYDAAVAAPLPWAAGASACVFGALAVLRAAGGDPPWLVAGLAAAAGLTLGVRIALRRWRLPLGWAHPVAAVAALFVGALALAGIAGTGDLARSTDLMLTIVVAGALLVSLPWVAGVIGGLWLGWCAVAIWLGPDPAATPWWAQAMVMAGLVGLAVNRAHRRSLDALGRALELAEAAATRDPLTDVANRRGLEMLAEPLIEAARRRGDAIHCLFVDIDGLKRVNDALGHAAGDEVLVAVAEAVASTTRGTDVVARWGGDEFCVVGPGPGMAPAELEERIRAHVRSVPPTPAEIWDAAVTVGGSVLAPWDDGGLTDLLSRADREMYRRRTILRRRPSPAPGPTPRPPPRPTPAHTER